MNKLLILASILATLSVKADVTITGTESTTATNIVKVIGRGSPRNSDTRVTTSTDVKRYALTFTWRGKTFTVTDDEKGATTTNYQAAMWIADGEAKAKAEAAASAPAKPHGPRAAQPK